MHKCLTLYFGKRKKKSKCVLLKFYSVWKALNSDISIAQENKYLGIF